MMPAENIPGAQTMIDLLQGFFNFGDFLSSVVSIVIYVLSSVALYTIAKRRNIHNPWLAWVPIGNMWILGCISDQYRYVAYGQEKSKRKALLVLEIISTVLLFALVAVIVVALVQIIAEAPTISLPIETMQAIEALPSDEQALAYLEMMIGMLVSDEALLGTLISYLAVFGMLSLALAGVSIAGTIVGYLAYYDLFASCEPANKMIYLVLGILFNTLLPIFTFICRNKDLGMPVRQGTITVE